MSEKIENVAAAVNDDEVVLEVKDLVVQYVVKKQTVEAVNGISFSLKKLEYQGRLSTQLKKVIIIRQLDYVSRFARY